MPNDEFGYSDDHGYFSLIVLYKDATGNALRPGSGAAQYQNCTPNIGPAISTSPIAR